MNDTPQNTLIVGTGRFQRFESIQWWDQQRLRDARVLVIGAGALGNEAIKNLCLLGIGRLAIVDMDCIEQSNLCRSILFRPGDEGRPKAERAAQAAREIYPEIEAVALVGNVLADVGLGWFRWADVVVGALDNREARVFVNQACAQLHRPWIDGGIEVLGGVVRGFNPPQTSCYECTMGQADWDLLAKRRSCSLLARQAFQASGAPTTPTTASVIGAIQAQEVVKRLHGLDVLDGSGFVFEGLRHNSYVVSYPVSPTCPWHEDSSEVEPVPEFTARTALRRVWERAALRLNGLDALDLARELVAKLDCPACGKSVAVHRPLEHLVAEQARCAACGAECSPTFLHSLTADCELLDRTPQQLGLPDWDILWGRHGETVLGIELSGDAPEAITRGSVMEICGGAQGKKG